MAERQALASLHGLFRWAASTPTAFDILLFVQKQAADRRVSQILRLVAAGARGLEMIRLLSRAPREAGDPVLTGAERFLRASRNLQIEVGSSRGRRT